MFKFYTMFLSLGKNVFSEITKPIDTFCISN